jgi:hypothetical protein
MPKKENVTSTNNPSLFDRITRYGSQFIDYKMGAMGAFVMGGIVFGVNYFGTHAWQGATTAALKQATYTFLFGGVIMRGCEYFATRIKKQSVALATAIIIPSVVAICFTYGVHSMKGTPKPMESTIPTAMLVIPSTAIWGLRKRRHFISINTLNTRV